MEYGVVDSIANGDVAVHQIAVEFHPWMGPHGRRATGKAIASLKRDGCTLFNQWHNDFSFIKTV